MRSGTNSLRVGDGLADRSDKTKETIQQERFSTFSEQQPTSDADQQKNVARFSLFKGADNPYAAALADVFGLEA